MPDPNEVAAQLEAKLEELEARQKHSPENEAQPVAASVSSTAIMDDELWQRRQHEEMMFHGRMRSLEMAIGVHMRRPKVKKDDEGTTITERIVSTAYVFHQFAIGAIDEAALLEDEDD